MEQYKFPNDPVATPESIVKGDQYRFTVINEFVIRYEWAEDGVFEDRPSTFAINRRFDTPEFQVTESEELLEIRTPSAHLSYDKKRFSTSGLKVSFTSKATKWGVDWRFGEEETERNLGGTARTLDKVDGRCDMGLGVLSRNGFATLDDSDTMLFEEDGFVSPRRSGDRIDGYLFHYGFEFKGAMKAFYAISGSQPLLPRWSLGNWWSRYHAYTDREYLELMDRFREQDIPLSVAVIDMDWHWVSEDFVPHPGWTGYSWNTKLFPDHKAFCDALHQRRLKTTLNDHPHSGVHSHEDLYEELAAVLGHDTSKKAPILFDPASPKFMHAYLNTLHRRLEEEGCDFWWIDWQQGPYSRVPGLDPLWLLNHFHYIDHKNQSKTSRAIIFSRYGGPGSHRYPVGFSGDTVVTWESLQFQPEFTATSSNIGYGWWSHDIGGHMKGYRDDELTTRWVQLGVFSPLMRLHSTHSQWMSKEPWLFRKEHEEAITSIMQYRHRLIPYLHSMNQIAANKNEPIVQPLYWKFPAREEAFQKPNEYFFGSELVVAPIVHARESSTNHASVEAWVPPGRHVDIFTGYSYDGDRQITMYRPLESIPVLAPEGAIIPLDANKSPENGCPNPSCIEVLVVVGKDGNFTLYEDCGDDDLDKSDVANTKTCSIQLNYKQEQGKLDISASDKSWTLRFLGQTDVPTSCQVFRNGIETSETDITIDRKGASSLVVQVPNTAGKNCDISIVLGDNPQLQVIDRVGLIKKLLLDFQLTFAVKDKILSVCSAGHSAAVKVSELLSLDIDDVIVGPIIELLTADSRTA